MKRQLKTARYRGLNDSAALAAQCAVKLLELRTHTGKTQKQLAARLRMTESMISRLERGDHVPSLKTLCRIADAFGRRLEIVFHEHGHEHGHGATMKRRRRMIHFTHRYAAKRRCSPDISTRTATGGDPSRGTPMITRQLHPTQ
jgi:transcriptional regulator with XRE-family HTH domain